MFDRDSAERFVAKYRLTVTGRKPVYWWRDNAGRIRKTDPAGDIHIPRTSSATSNFIISAAIAKRERKQSRRASAA